MTTDKAPLIGMTLGDLTNLVESLNMPRYTARQIASWLYVKRVDSIDAMTDLSKERRKQLSLTHCIGREAPLAYAISSDGTAKYLFTGATDRDIEAVVIPDRDRTTLCVSSQAGCRMNCAFCMTGRGGFNGQLSAAQIINQVLSVPESESLTNIVFMGMGEPTDNLEAVLKTIDILTSPWGFAWSPKRITLSTIGNIPALKRVLDETKVHIAISVHNPFPEARAEIMPAQKAWPIEKVIQLLRNYDFTAQRRLSVEYTMWHGLNDSDSHASALARLLKGTAARVNLIRFHPVPGFNAVTATTDTMTHFRDKLNSLGITATIRTSRGEDIDAACGMLAGKNKRLNG